MTSSAKGTLAPASILAESWSIAAEGYDEIFVPRFKPWTDNALALLGSTEFKLPAGDVLVPTCGPGHELPLVAELLKNRNVRGTDLAPGMIDVAQKRCEGDSRLSCAVEDAMAPSGEYAALFSVFGLQQMPDHAQAIQAWTRCLKIGGVAVVVFWPMGEGVEKRGPWAHWGRLLKAALGDGARRGVQGWEDALPSAIESAGGEVLFAHPLKYRIECRALRRNQLQRATRHRRDVGTVIASGVGLTGLFAHRAERVIHVRCNDRMRSLARAPPKKRRRLRRRAPRRLPRALRRRRAARPRPHGAGPSVP